MFSRHVMRSISEMSRRHPCRHTDDEVFLSQFPPSYRQLVFATGLADDVLIYDGHYSYRTTTATFFSGEEMTPCSSGPAHASMWDP